MVDLDTKYPDSGSKFSQVRESECYQQVNEQNIQAPIHSPRMVINVENESLVSFKFEVLNIPLFSAPTQFSPQLSPTSSLINDSFHF